MNIRYATEQDANLLAELGHKTFHQTFIDQNDPADIALYLKEHFSEEIQRSEIKEPDAIFLIAEEGAAAIGYVKLNANAKESNISCPQPMELQRIYILQEHIGKGRGAELMKAAIQEATKLGCGCLWLGVWEKNERAIAFYEKWGFKKAGRHSFVVGQDVQDDFIMDLALS